MRFLIVLLIQLIRLVQEILIWVSFAQEIANGLNNKISLGGNKYQGTMSDGTTLTIYLDDAGNVKSAFPELLYE